MKEASLSFGALLTICCGITFGCYAAAFMRLPVVPIYAQSLGVDTAQIGVINAAFFLMAGLLSLPLGLAADRFGRKRLAAAGLLLLAAASIGLFACRTFLHFTLAYLALGVGIAAFGPTMMTLVSLVAPPTHFGRAYGWYTTALFCGMSLGPAVGGLLAEAWGAPRVFLTAGLVLVLDTIFLLALLPARPMTPDSTDLHDDRDGGLVRLLNNRPLLGGWLMTLGACFGLGMFTSFMPLHAQDQGLDVGWVGIVFFVQGLCNGGSRIPFGRLSDRVAQRSRLVVAGIALFIFALAVCGWAATPSSFLFAAGLVGISMGLAFTSLGALIAEAVPAKSRGSAMGGYNACVYLGMMLSSAVMGKVCEVFGFAAGFYLAAALNLLTAGLFIWLIRGSARSASVDRLES